MIKNKNSVVFGCFSPPVMIATFIFEILAMLYILFRYKLNAEAKIVSALLFNLAIFQLAEYQVCQNSGLAELASRIGYVAITLLPVMGLHLMALISKSSITKQLKISYLFATAISIYFLLYPGSFQSYECTGNYVIFQIGEHQAWIYSAYYFGFIVATLIYGLIKSSHKNIVIKRNISWLTAGYALFITPVAIVTVTHPDSRRAVPSILCGFAVLFAVVLVSKISPRILKKR